MIGVMVILSAVFIAAGRKGNITTSRKDLGAGIFYGVLAIAAMAVGVVMIKPLLSHSPLFWAVEIRLMGGLMVLGCVLSLHPKRSSILGTLASGQSWKYTVSGSFVGTYLALVLWLAGMKFAQVSVVAALNQTSNIFIFIFAAVFLNESINLRRAAAIFLGVTGSVLVTFS
jgi:drug/metabolite transporter (DMT)-like permease